MIRSKADTQILPVITGPTASGKSALAVSLALLCEGEVISADSRQIYAGLPITTAAPAREEMQGVRHHLIGTLPLDAYYSANCFRDDAIHLATEIFARHKQPIVCGGSMMYVDALCNGIDELPTVPEHIRTSLSEEWKEKGDQWLLSRLDELDAQYAAKVDRCNLKRVFHAVEVSLTAGVPYSSLLTGCNRREGNLPWQVRKIALRLPRNLLFDRINRRVEAMVASGMVEEVARVSTLRDANSLNTVGVKEMLRFIDGEWTLEEAKSRLAKNTRVYAKKQMTWLQRDPTVEWIDIDGSEKPDEIAELIYRTTLNRLADN